MQAIRNEDTILVLKSGKGRKGSRCSEMWNNNFALYLLMFTKPIQWASYFKT